MGRFQESLFHAATAVPLREIFLVTVLTLIQVPGFFVFCTTETLTGIREKDTHIQSNVVQYHYQPFFYGTSHRRTLINARLNDTVGQE